MTDGNSDGISLPSFGNAADLFGGGQSDCGDLSAVPVNNNTGEQVSEAHSSGNADPSSHVNFGHAIGAAWDALPTTVIEPVWNSGFWKCIFGNDMLGSNLEQQFKRPLPSSFITDDVAEDVEIHKKQCLPSFAVGMQPHFKSCVKCTDDVTWQEHREAQLQKALKHWLVIILTWSADVEFVQCITGCDSVNSQLIMLGDVFRGKAPGTLSKRSNSMKILCEQLERIGLSFPCSEASLYGVLCELRRQGAPASRSKGILEAIAFVRFTMGIVECDALLRGKRCWGAATSDAPLHRNQASPLQVKELEKLHSVLENSTDIWDKMFSGTVLFVVYSRARWSDAQHGASVVFDEDFGEIHYVEVLTGLHKTMRALQHRHQFLPLVAPAVGVTKQNWGALWKQVRSELCIDFAQGHALMPAPLEDGTPGKRALDSQEAGKWLRSLLLLDDGNLENRKVSSHSLKSTMLSYLAKRGVDMADRLLLGYHTSPFTMGLTYSRDGMARPLEILGNMLEEIRNGLYFPDCTRSGRLYKPKTNTCETRESSVRMDECVKIEISDDENIQDAWTLVEESTQNLDLPPVIPETCEDAVNDACTETSSSDVSELEDDRSGFERSGRSKFEPPVAPEGFTMWQHTKSKILHLCDHRTPNIFECGRKAGPFHTSEGLQPRWDSGICWRCFKNR